MPCTIVNVRANSLEEIREKTGKWNLYQKQLQTGDLVSWSFGVFLPGIDFGFRQTSLPIVEYGLTPDKRLTLFFPDPEGSIAVSGCFDGPDSQLVFPVHDLTVAHNTSAATHYGISITHDLLESFESENTLKSLKLINGKKAEQTRLIRVDPCHKQSLKGLLMALVDFFQLNHEFSEISLRDIQDLLCIAVAEYLAEVEGDKRSTRTISQGRKERILRKAMEHIYSSDIRNVSIQSILEHCATTSRNLEYIFKEKIGDTPKAHLIKMRLGAIRQELISPENFRKSISEIIEDYGVINTGRFCRDYFNFFGEFPKETRKKFSYF